MRLGEYNEIISWTDDSKLLVDNYHVLSRRPVTAWSVRVPDTYLRMLVMNNVLFGHEPEESFHESALWITSTFVWDEQNSIKLFNRVRMAASGDSRDMNTAPVTIFESNEFEDFHLLTLLAILGAWDGYVIPRHGRFFFALSHDGFVDMVYQDHQEAKKMNDDLNQLKFAVSPLSEEKFMVGNERGKGQ